MTISMNTPRREQRTLQRISAMSLRLTDTLTSVVLVLALSATTVNAEPVQATYGDESVKGVDIFYREAENQSNPSIAMLHGFPSSSHRYRHFIDDMSNHYHVIAPDYPGFGSSDLPSAEQFAYTFDNLVNLKARDIE